MRMLSIVVLMSTLLSGCMSSKVVFDESFNRRPPVTYEDYFDYYFLGLKGDNMVSLNQVCLTEKPLAVEYLYSVEDIVISAFALGIYTPRTLRVWCGP